MPYHDLDTTQMLRILEDSRSTCRHAFDRRILPRDHNTPAKHRFCVFAARITTSELQAVWLCSNYPTGGICQPRHRFQLHKRLVQSLPSCHLPSPLNVWLFLDRAVISFISSSSICLPLSRFNDLPYLSLYDSTPVSTVNQRINTSEEGLILPTICGGSGGLGKVFANRGILLAPSPFLVKAATWIKYVVSATRSVKTRTWKERKITKF